MRDDTGTESAVVIAARQLADEARLRPLPYALRRRRPLVVPPSLPSDTPLPR